MKNRTASLTALILLSLFVLLSFMPIVFGEIYWKASTPGVGHYSQVSNSGISFFSNVALPGFFTWIAVFILVFSVFGIVILLMQYIGKSNKLTCFSRYVAIIPTVLFIVLSVLVFLKHVPYGTGEGTATSGYYGYWTYVPAWGFYIECALLIATSVICMLSKTSAKSSQTEYAPRRYIEHSTTDELKKYKELLDIGVITQEEFDAKKKQLLGL